MIRIGRATLRITHGGDRGKSLLLTRIATEATADGRDYTAHFHRPWPTTGTATNQMHEQSKIQADSDEAVRAPQEM